MQPHLFNKVMHDVYNYDAYFVHKCDAAGILGLLLEQKLIAIIRMLVYGSSADQVDEIARMRKSTTLESLVRFCDAIKTLYTRNYLRKPTPRDLQRFLQKSEAQVAGTQNDLNVLGQSPVFNDVLRGEAPNITYEINSTVYWNGYYLVDDIYLRWTTFVKSILHP
ncbi:unnamed protein product [Prunus brigantina]